MVDYRVNLDVFSGPLDLLLYLVRKEEVDIYDISIAKITNQYLQYIEMLKKLDINLVGDFLVMAASLMQIKSAMLLPDTDSEQLLEGDPADPRAELIRQLLEYKKFKDAANLLDASAQEAKNRFGRGGTVIEKLTPDAEPAVDIDQVSMWDLLEAFDSIMAATGEVSLDVSCITDETPIDLYQIEILHRLQTEGAMGFERIFESNPNRLVFVGLFLALLELIREKLIWAEQTKPCGDIYLRTLTTEPAEQAVGKAIAAAEAENEKAGQAEQKSPPVAIVEVTPRHPSTTAQGTQKQDTTVERDCTKQSTN